MMDDLNLVRAFNEARSEDAFAELVGRHVDFVYRTALRVLDGDVYQEGLPTNADVLTNQ